ncbi:epimerase [Citrobacter amalonaticus]|uniref:Epimerase n=1 Tax=Citrobacter amalonaticus TaxID=35703 RepID=A0A2S4S131_CITAM|nr:ribulose-phosphate 3 epimerase family protein [Citrobacter amalonaticus]POT55246.1 epimerase [Citrobacter amalonaticus]POT77146.1 epimerase [Citrobacter amalonaticus]POU67597.1 epimerase [Citrobacter amalonaticus]POV07202.1 epimerase [Citrobacter amalonaticus]
MIVHPSLASANPLHYGRELTALDNMDLGSLHLDIEDSSFINNITFGMKTVQAVARQTQHPLSFHFMVARPQPWLAQLSALKPNWIFVHAETLEYPSEILAEIRNIGAKAGLAFNPATPVEAYHYLVPQLDALMVMTSEPDSLGQRFIPSMCAKIGKIREIFPQAECWADGGITLMAAQQLAAAGVQHAVVGRALFSSSDYRTTLSQFSAL